MIEMELAITYRKSCFNSTFLSDKILFWKLSSHACNLMPFIFPKTSLLISTRKSVAFIKLLWSLPIHEAITLFKGTMIIITATPPKQLGPSCCLMDVDSQRRTIHHFALEHITSKTQSHMTQYSNYLTIKNKSTRKSV